MPIPQNAQAIYNFLVGKGFSTNAAAGILGNIEQESGGDPGAFSPAGGGLFGLTIANGGSPHGGTLQQELDLLLNYINKNGSVADVNAHAATPTAAAVYFSDRYERPGIPNIQNRIQSAIDVFNAAKSGNWPQSAGTGGSGGGFGDPFSGLISILTGPIKDIDAVVHAFVWFFKPENWVRIIAGTFGVLILTIGTYTLVKAGS